MQPPSVWFYRIVAVAAARCMRLVEPVTPITAKPARQLQMEERQQLMGNLQVHLDGSASSFRAIVGFDVSFAMWRAKGIHELPARRGGRDHGEAKCPSNRHEAA